MIRKREEICLGCHSIFCLPPSQVGTKIVGLKVPGSKPPKKSHHFFNANKKYKTFNDFFRLSQSSLNER
jgi:hypothetical protein